MHMRTSYYLQQWLTNCIPCSEAKSGPLPKRGLKYRILAIRIFLSLVPITALKFQSSAYLGDTDLKTDRVVLILDIRGEPADRCKPNENCRIIPHTTKEAKLMYVSGNSRTFSFGQCLRNFASSIPNSFSGFVLDQFSTSSSVEQFLFWAIAAKTG